MLYRSNSLLIRSSSRPSRESRSSITLRTKNVRTVLRLASQKEELPLKESLLDKSQWTPVAGSISILMLFKSPFSKRRSSNIRETTRDRRGPMVPTTIQLQIVLVKWTLTLLCQSQCQRGTIESSMLLRGNPSRRDPTTSQLSQSSLTNKLTPLRWTRNSSSQWMIPLIMASIRNFRQRRRLTSLKKKIKCGKRLKNSQ